MSSRRTQLGLVAYRASSEIASKGAFFIVTLVAARRLSTDDFGVFSLGTTIGWIAAVATDFGIQLHLARAVAQRPDEAGALLFRWLRVRLLTSILAIIVVAGGLLAVRSSVAFTRDILLFTAVYVVSGLVEFLHYFYRGLSRTDIESSLTLAQRAGTLVLGVGVLWWQPRVPLLAIALLGPVLATLFYSLRRANGLARVALPHAVGSNDISTRPALASVLPIGAGIVLSALYFRIDLFLVDAWTGTTAAGLYNAVFRLVEALRLFPAAVIAVGLPALFRATSRRPLAEMAAGLLIASCALSLVLAWIAAPLIALLYGAAFSSAVPAFRILLVAFPLMSLNYALTHQLIGWHGHRAYAVICAVALVFNLAANTRMIPAFGIEGAAWTTLWTEVVLAAGCVVALARGRVGLRSSTAPALETMASIDGAAAS